MGHGAVDRRAFIAGLAAMATAPAVAGCRGPGGEESSVTTTTGVSALVEFPSPTTSSVPLEAALERRRSVREYSPEALRRAEIGQLLWAAQGVTADWGGRTAPSAGALYPLELYAVTAEAMMRYAPVQHRGEVLADSDLRSGLMAAALDQESVGEAPLVVAVVGVPARTANRYGGRAARYVDLEAGHAAQNVLLQAVALDLVAVPIGAFDDDDVARVLALPDGHVPRYLIPVGRPR